MTPRPTPTDRAADPGRTPADPAAQGRSANPPGGAPRPSSSLIRRERTVAGMPGPDTGAAAPGSTAAAPVRERAPQTPAGGEALTVPSLPDRSEVLGDEEERAALRAARQRQAGQRGQEAIAVSAHCGGCDWTPEGDWATVDKAADKHARRPGHPVTVAAGPAGGAG